MVNNYLDKDAGTWRSQSDKNTIANQIDVQVMKDAVMLPRSTPKALLYRSPTANATVMTVFGMYDYGGLGMK